MSTFSDELEAQSRNIQGQDIVEAIGLIEGYSTIFNEDNSFLKTKGSRNYSLIKKLIKFLLIQKKKILLLLVLGGLSYFWNKKRNNKPNKIRKVAVIGSGIAGCGAAYTLAKSGIETTVYEKKPSFGGNAKSYTWDINGNKVRTGLAVLAWPDDFFHNYNALINDLKIKTFKHPLKFLITSSVKQEDDSIELSFAHDPPDKLPKWAQEDLIKWQKMANFVRRVNSFFQPCEYKSLYRMNFLNPLNLISLKTFCGWFGLSDKFWNYIFVPLHTSTFLELDLDSVPAVMAETLEDIMPLVKTPIMVAWEKDAKQPIDEIMKMKKIIPKRSCSVEKVEYFENKEGVIEVYITDENEVVEKYDAVIFACSARAMTNILHTNSQVNGNNTYLRNQLEQIVFRKTLYSHDRDEKGTFNQGVVHKNACVLPTKYRKNILDSYCNYMEVDREDPTDLENTFVISSWAPTIHNTTSNVVKEHFKNSTKEGMFVSYNVRDKLKDEDCEWTSTSREAHPSLTTWQLFASQMLWPRLQGSRQKTTYFCGSAVTPGNGHDLSLLSGIITATELGATYPFKTKKAIEDFNKLKAMMLPLL